MKTMITLYVLAMLTVIGYGLYHAPWWLIVGVFFPMGSIIAACLLDDYRRLRARNGSAL